MRLGLLGIVLALALVGCTQASTAMLDDRTAIISASGGTAVSMAEVQQRAFLEAAKLTQAKGFRYFVLLGVSDASRTGAIVNRGATFDGGGGTTFQGPSSVVPVIMPGANITIRMFRETEKPSGDGTWDSVAIIAALESPK